METPFDAAIDKIHRMYARAHKSMLLASGSTRDILAATVTAHRNTLDILSAEREEWILKRQSSQKP